MENRIGEKYITNEGYEIKIIEYFNNTNCTIQFEDGVLLENIAYGNITRGKVKNRYHKSVHEVGFLGVGTYSKSKHLKIYNAWNNMLERCYNEKCQEKFPTYKGCMVTKNWLNFQLFAQWFEDNWKHYMDKTWQLDKDILKKGNKIYSPETCCFVPQEINKLLYNSKNKSLIGVSHHKNKFTAKIYIRGRQVYLGIFNTKEEAFEAYKIAKEAYIKEVADLWRSKITESIYQALINYKVEITD